MNDKSFRQVILKILVSLILLLVVVGTGLAGWTVYRVAQIEAEFQPVGEFAGPEGRKTHYLDVPAESANTAPVLFVHGASGNLNDQRFAFEEKLKGSRRLIFVDRPGHGYSDRGDADNPMAQATRYRELMDELKIDKAVLVGHSLGAASVAAFGVLYSERVQGLVFLAPATHPWPGGVTWYYDVGALPVIGPIFTRTLLMPVGTASVPSGARNVFDPNTAPENYVSNTAVPLVLRPSHFEANAEDVAGLNDFVREFSKRYSEIKAPTVIITGDTDDVVAPHIHSVGLERDIEGSKLIVLPDVGHKPDYVATDTVINAIDAVSNNRLAELPVTGASLGGK
ncbi:MAG: alpha/beta hydrolase [Pseudomonadota bacterium]